MTERKLHIKKLSIGFIEELFTTKKVDKKLRTIDVISIYSARVISLTDVLYVSAPTMIEFNATILNRDSGDSDEPKCNVRLFCDPRYWKPSAENEGWRMEACFMLSLDVVMTGSIDISPEKKVLRALISKAKDTHRVVLAENGVERVSFDFWQGASMNIFGPGVDFKRIVWTVGSLYWGRNGTGKLDENALRLFVLAFLVSALPLIWMRYGNRGSGISWFVGEGVFATRWASMDKGRVQWGEEEDYSMEDQGVEDQSMTDNRRRSSVVVRLVRRSDECIVGAEENKTKRYDWETAVEETESRWEWKRSGRNEET